MILTKDQAIQVWEILVATCGADSSSDAISSRQQFIHATGTTRRVEFRFQGKLGFGGKVYVEEPPRVSCYPEDSTPERVAMIKKANEQLSLL